MGNGVVVSAFYNRTPWDPGRRNNDVPLTEDSDIAQAIVFGKFIPTHKYESVYAEWHTNPGEDELTEYMWERLQACNLFGDDLGFPIQDRSMAIGDIVCIDRIDDDFSSHPIAAWVAQLDGWGPCPEFLITLRSLS